MSDLQWLQRWYQSQCNGDWEHMYGITISSRGNAGWALAIAVSSTALEAQPFAPTEIRPGEEDGFACDVREGQFIGTAGPAGLVPLLAAFRTWASGPPEAAGSPDEPADPLPWLQAWYVAQREGGVAEGLAIEIDTLDNPGWMVDVATEQGFDPRFLERIDRRDPADAGDWLVCEVRGTVFGGAAGPTNLGEILAALRALVTATIEERAS